MSWLKEVVNNWPMTSAFVTVMIVSFIIFMVSKSRKKDEMTTDQTPRTWTVPEDRQEEMWGYWNQWSKHRDFVARYKFWKTTEDLFPETKDIATHFEDGDFVLTIIEGKGDDED
jgi:hypothetical protein